MAVTASVSAITILTPLKCAFSELFQRFLHHQRTALPRFHRLMHCADSLLSAALRAPLLNLTSPLQVVAP